MARSLLSLAVRARLFYGSWNAVYHYDVPEVLFRVMNAQESFLITERYVVEGSGTFKGAVEIWDAVDQQLERPVTIQILGKRKSANRQACDAFLRHQRAASSIQESAILAVYDAGVWEERAFSVMQRLPGATASNVYHPGRPPDVALALAATQQVAEGLRRCREEGLADWAFSPEAVYVGTEGDAHLGIIEGLPTSNGESDAEALGKLLRLMLTGNRDSNSAQLREAQVPETVIALLERLQLSHNSDITSAGEVAAAIAALENASTQPTEAYEALHVPIADVPLDATRDLSEAPTLVSTVVPPLQRVAQVATDGTGSSYIESPAPERITKSLDIYVPSTSDRYNPAIISRRMPWLVPGLLVLLMLVVGFLGLKLFSPVTRAEGQSVATPTPTPGVAQKVLTDVTVPDLRGKSLDAATTFLQLQGLILVRSGSAYNPTYTSGQIASQQPAPGTQLKAGSAVTVSLSLGQAPGTIAVSNPHPPAPAPPSKKGPDDNKGKGKPPDKGHK